MREREKREKRERENLPEEFVMAVLFLSPLPVN